MMENNTFTKHQVATVAICCLGIAAWVAFCGETLVTHFPGALWLKLLTVAGCLGLMSLGALSMYDGFWPWVARSTFGLKVYAHAPARVVKLMALAGLLYHSGRRLVAFGVLVLLVWWTTH